MSTPIGIEATPGTTIGAVYTAPAGARVRITTIVATNTTGAAATITLEHVPSGQAPGTGFMVASAVSVAANAESSLLPAEGNLEEINLAPGDSLQALQGTANAINLSINGEELDFGAQS